MRFSQGQRLIRATVEAVIAEMEPGDALEISEWLPFYADDLAADRTPQAVAEPIAADPFLPVGE